MSSGIAATDSANRTRPPIAKTSDRAFAAAISPKVRGSSTIGGKKSSVPMTATPGATRWTAASSGGSRPAISPVDRRRRWPAPETGERLGETSAPSFAAQPPHSVSSVSRIGGGLEVEHARIIGPGRRHTRSRPGEHDRDRGDRASA